METPIIYWWNMPPAAQASLDPAFTFMIDDSEERPTAQELYDNIICSDCVLIVTGENWIPAELAFIAGMAMAMGKTFYVVTPWKLKILPDFAGYFQFETIEEAFKTLKDAYCQETDTDSW